MSNRCHTRMGKQETNCTNWHERSIISLASFVLIREIRVFSLWLQLVLGLVCAGFLSAPVGQAKAWERY